MCVNARCEQIAHDFRRKKVCWARVERALTAPPFSADPSPSSRHIKGVRGGGGGEPAICLPSHRKSSRRIGMCFRPHELSGVLLPEPRPTPQRENPAAIALSSPEPRRLGYSVQTLCPRRPLSPFSLSVCLECLLSLHSVSKHTQIHATRF